MRPVSAWRAPDGRETARWRPWLSLPRERVMGVQLTDLVLTHGRADHHRPLGEGPGIAGAARRVNLKVDLLGGLIGPRLNGWLTFAGFLHTADSRHTFEVSQEEREAFWEKLYNEPGFGIWVGNFNDILTNKDGALHPEPFADHIAGD